MLEEAFIEYPEALRRSKVWEAMLASAIVVSAVAFGLFVALQPPQPQSIATNIPANAEVVSVYDGDTITVDISLGFDVVLQSQKIRLYGINAPEVRGPEREEGIKARDALRGRLSPGTLVRLQPEGRGKYGRYVAHVSHEGEDISAWMVSGGHAEYRVYSEGEE